MTSDHKMKEIPLPMPPPCSNLPSPAQRAAANGLASLSDAELLTLTLMQEPAHDWQRHLDAFALLLQAYGSLTALTAATLPPKDDENPHLQYALRLHAIRHLHLRLAAEDTPPTSSPLTSTQAAAAVLIPLLGAALEETLIVLPANAALQPLYPRTVAIGSDNLVSAAPPQLLRPAIEANAPNMFIAHNHPDGDLTPSIRDWTFTAKIARAARLMDMTLQDHLIIAGTAYRSMRQQAPGHFEPEDTTSQEQ